MAEYNVTGPDGTKYKVTGPEGASDEEVLSQVKGYKPPKQEAAAPKEDPESTLGFISGNINKGLAGLVGMPVDTARNVANLGIAGYGRVKGALGGKPPDLIPPGPGSSEWFEGLGKKAGMIGPSAEPTSGPGKYAAAGLQALPSAMLGRPTAPQIPRAVTSAVTSGVGAQAGKDIAPEGYEQAGALAGSVIPGGPKMLKTPGAGERATAERKSQAFGQAKELGIPVPPREMNPDPVQQKIQNAAAKELKLPEGTELSPPILQDYRTAHYKQGYEPVMKDPGLKGIIMPTPAFNRQIRTMKKEEEKLRNEFPGSVKDVGVQKALDDLLQPMGLGFSADGAMAQIKRMREAATNNLSSPSANDDTIRLGLYQRKMATALDDLVESNVKQIGKPELITNFREARKAIAQSHDIESSLDPSTRRLDPRKLAILQTDGRPVSGQIKELADVAAAFPGAVQKPKDLSRDDMFTHRVTPMAVTHPTAMGAHFLARMGDPITTSKPYQELFVNPKNKLTPEQERLVRALIGEQSANQPQ